MSTESIPRLIKPVATEPIGDRIRLTDELEVQVRRIVQEELREFLLVERRAARLIDSYVAQRLGLNTT
jgi:hypothetical protein